MRILFSTPDIDSGGPAKSLSILVERLRRRHEVAILSYNPPAPGKPELIVKMAGNAFVFAREHFNPDANARQIEEYLFQG